MYRQVSSEVLQTKTHVTQILISAFEFSNHLFIDWIKNTAGEQSICYASVLTGNLGLESGGVHLTSKLVVLPFLRLCVCNAF